MECNLRGNVKSGIFAGKMKGTGIGQERTGLVVLQLNMSQQFEATAMRGMLTGEWA